MLTLITGQKEIESLIDSIDWHGSYIKEVHFAPAQFQDENHESSGSTVCHEASLVRLLIALPENSHALEIVAFDAESCSIYPLHDLDEDKTAMIQRRVAELDFGAFTLKCACVGYRACEVSAAEFGQFYSKENLFLKDGNLVAPYSIDWRTALDEAFQNR